MLVRDRIGSLLVPGTPFLELSTLPATWPMTASFRTHPGIGIGIVSGKEVSFTRRRQRQRWRVVSAIGQEDRGARSILRSKTVFRSYLCDSPAAFCHCS